MIASNIQRTKQTLEERGIPQDSFFVVEFEDGSSISEKEANWSSFCEQKEVNYVENKKIVNVSRFPVKKISCFHEGLEASLDVPEGCQAYQAIRAEALIVHNVQRRDRTLGRIIGIIKDDQVIEEIFLNGLQHIVEGFRK